MSLFGKKKEEKKDAGFSCSCGCGCDTTITTEKAVACCGEKADGICCIKVLGSGCKSCHALYENTKEAVAKVGLDVNVEHVTDMQKIMEYCVMSMPALVINEQVVSMGRVLKATDVMDMLKRFGVQ